MLLLFLWGLMYQTLNIIPMYLQYFITAVEMGHIVHYVHRPNFKNYYKHVQCGRLQAREAYLIAFTTDTFRFVDFLKGNVEEYLESDVDSDAPDADDPGYPAYIANKKQRL